VLLNADYIAPANLTGYVRAALADLTFPLDAYLPNQHIDDLSYRFAAGGEGLTEAASYRAFDAEAQIGARPGVRIVSGELPPLSRKIRFGEYDRLRQRSNANASITSGLLTDAARMTRQIALRMQQARGDALVNGTLTIEENGLSLVVDYGRDPACTVTAATLWSASGAQAFTDLVAWYDAYVALNSVAPGSLLTSNRIARLMQQSPEVIAAVAGTQTGRTRVTVDELNGLLGSEGLPSVTVVDGTTYAGGQRVIPDDVVLLLPPAGDGNNPDSTDLGATLWGTTAESLEPGYGIEDGSQPGIVAGTYTTDDPVALWTKVAAIGLPILANPDLSFAAKVV
jgi:hypothetical protein